MKSAYDPGFAALSARHAQEASLEQVSGKWVHRDYYRRGHEPRIGRRARLQGRESCSHATEAHVSGPVGRSVGATAGDSSRIAWTFAYLPSHRVIDTCSPLRFNKRPDDFGDSSAYNAYLEQVEAFGEF